MVEFTAAVTLLATAAAKLASALGSRSIRPFSRLSPGDLQQEVQWAQIRSRDLRYLLRYLLIHSDVETITIRGFDTDEDNREPIGVPGRRQFSCQCRR